MAEKKQLFQIWDNLAFARLFQSLTMALSPVRMVIAMGTILVICLIGWTMDFASMRSDEPVLDIDDVVDFGSSMDTVELRPYVQDPGNALVRIEEYRHTRRARGVFSTLWHIGTARFTDATVSLFKLEITDVLINIWFWVLAFVWAIKLHPIYSAIYFVIMAAIISVSGGAICRTAALEFARGEKPGLTEALRFGVKRFKHLITAPLVLTAITVSLGACVFFIGLLGNINYAGELIMALLFGVALVFGLLTVLFLIGSVFGANLAFPVIAYEGSDGFDAISRSFCYVYTRPWWLFCYTTIAAAFGTVSYLFVRLFGYLLLVTTWLLMDVGIFSRGEEPAKLARIWAKPNFFELLGTNAGPANVTESIASFIIHITVLLVIGLVVAFVVSFYFCSSTIVYSLMRRKVDNIDMDRIYIPLEQPAEQSQIRKTDQEQNEDL